MSSWGTQAEEQSNHHGSDWRLALEPDTGRWALRDYSGETLVRAASSVAYPSSAFAVRREGEWHALGRPDGVDEADGTTTWTWHKPEATIRFVPDGHGHALHLDAPGAEATAMAWTVEPDEHFYGLGERFNVLDQRGEVVELWVKNGAAGGETYKPVPWVLSTKPYGIAVDTSCRTYMALAHPTTPNVATITVESSTLAARLFAGAHPTDALAQYTSWIGRPPVPPSWFFRPWKSRDWRAEEQTTVLDDVAKHQEYALPLGVKLIDATWETESHSFRFDTEKYPDVPGMMRTLQEQGIELVLWISPNMTEGSPEYDECARNGYLITDADGQPYVHRLGNQPGWEGSAVDFTNPAAVAWWQEQVRSLMELGVRGLKTDFGEQVPIDAQFHNGKTGAEMHNLYPVLYNRATWAVVREYDGVLLARSAWAGSQQYPGIWSGDQSADFSPWAGLPSAIVAGQSAGMSGFPYWGSDVGGYFNPPDDEVFSRWAQFGAVSPVMEVHGLGCREPWLFSERTLAIYREAAELHDRLVPYSLAASVQAAETGLPLMRAMALIYPECEDAHLDWVRFQYLYGPDLLAAPVFSWGTSRPMWFPPGEWIDVATGEVHAGPLVTRITAPLEKLPLYARAGSVIPMATGEGDALELQVFAGNAARPSTHRLPDGTTIVLEIAESGEGRVEVSGTERPFTVRFPHRPDLAVTSPAGSQEGWTAPASVTFGRQA